MSETVGLLPAAGNVAEVFEWGSRVVKLYRSVAAKQAAFREAANHAAVEEMNLPVPAVWGVHLIDARWGILFDHVKHPSFAERMREDPTAVPQYLETLAALQARIHAHPASPVRQFEAAAGDEHRPDEPPRRAAKGGPAHPSCHHAGRRPPVP